MYVCVCACVCARVCARAHVCATNICFQQGHQEGWKERGIGGEERRKGGEGEEGKEEEERRAHQMKGWEERKHNNKGRNILIGLSQEKGVA